MKQQELSTLVEQFPVSKGKPAFTQNLIQFQATRPEFEGDITLVVFGLSKAMGAAPDVLANEIGNYLKEKDADVEAFNVVKGFLNISFTAGFWLKFLKENYNNSSYGQLPSKNNLVLVEYSSPNTNKPLHLGHLRNNFVGNSAARILQAAGSEVKKVQVINDRGIHICKSMLAWKKFGNGETPQSSGLKGDKLVGKYYVEFDKQYKAEIENLVQTGMAKEEAEKKAPVILEAQEMLRKWEAGDAETIELWKTMNGWVYDGFNQTYKTIGVDFDKLYYESNTYLLGKDIVEEGLKKNIFYKKDDNSVWCDLSDVKLDPKVLQRSDGTSVYMTQDVGTAVLRYKDFPAVKGMIYVVGNEQDHHFKVLFAILKKLGYEWANKLHHLSYGMVDLPSGKMKSREGTVVDADDLVEEMEAEAAKITAELGKTTEFGDDEKKKLYHTLALGALKYFILKVDPKKRMLFNPAESIDFQGNTGPFIQYTHARISTLLVKSGATTFTIDTNVALKPEEKTVIRTLSKYPQVVEEAAAELSPAHVANYIYELVKAFNHFYQTVQILKEEDAKTREMRLALCVHTRHVIKHGLNLLGIEAPEKM